MRKKTIITRDNLLKLYPKGPYVMPNNFHVNGGRELRIGVSEFRNLEEYSLRRASKRINNEITNTTMFDEGPIGFYEIKHLTNVTNDRFIILPSEYIVEVEVQAVTDIIRPVLEKFMKGRYYFKSNGIDQPEFIYLHYPEFTITNSIGESHLIKDMVIRLRTTEDGIYSRIDGKRFSFTKQELALGYSHSHLSTGVAESSNFTEFCLGNTSALRKYLDSLNTSCTANQFELLLVQIEQYLIWESIEGTPYISISRLFTNNQGDTPSVMSTVYRLPIAHMFVERLTPEALFAVDDYTYVLNTTTGIRELFRIEQEVTKEALEQGRLTNNKLYDFDLSTESYQASQSSYRDCTLPANLTSSETSEIRNTLKITPQLYETQQLKPLTTAIRRIGSADLTYILQTVNELLTYGHRINGQNNISSESKNINNGEVAVTSNNPTQSVSNQQRVVGAVAI